MWFNETDAWTLVTESCINVFFINCLILYVIDLQLYFK